MINLMVENFALDLTFLMKSWLLSDHHKQIVEAIAPIQALLRSYSGLDIIQRAGLDLFQKPVVSVKLSSQAFTAS